MWREFTTKGHGIIFSGAEDIPYLVHQQNPCFVDIFLKAFNIYISKIRRIKINEFKHACTKISTESFPKKWMYSIINQKSKEKS